MARINFDASNVQPAKDFEPLAPGWYAAQIVNSEMRETKNGNGEYLYLELDLIESYHPEQKGRKLFDRLNLNNPNTTAVEIARRTLSAICGAAGFVAVEDSEELHHIPMAVKVRIRAARGDYGPSNEIAQYDPIEERFPTQGAQPVTRPAPVQDAAPKPEPAPIQNTNTSSPPWKR